MNENRTQTAISFNHQYCASLGYWLPSSFLPMKTSQTASHYHFGHIRLLVQTVNMVISLSVCLSVCLSGCQSVCLSVCPCIFLVFSTFSSSLHRPSASRSSAVYPSPPFIYLRVEVFRCLPSSTMPCSGRQGLQMRDGVLRSATWQRREQIDFLTD